MPTIRISGPHNTPAVQSRDFATEDTHTKFSEGELDTTMRFYHPGSDTELQMFEVTTPPNYVIGQHAHAADEIMYVVTVNSGLVGRLWPPDRRFTFPATPFIRSGLDPKV